MKDIKIIRMSIRNFKGIRELDIDFDGKDTDILGRNATGKTSIKDAFNWLLFNKNSDGKTDFGIKPTGSDGEVIHNLETSVEATFDIEGDVKQFKKTLSEVWTRKRGAAEATFTRNENGYYVNSVPKKKTEYAQEVGNLIDEDLFRMITDPLYFNLINWKDRRKILIDVCGNISDEDVIASTRGLEPLADELKGRTVEEYRSILKTDMKSVNKELDSIPAKIHEAELAKPFVDDEIEEEKRDNIIAEINSLAKQRMDIENGAGVAGLKSKLNELYAKAKNVGSDFNIYTTNEYQKIVAIKDGIAEAEHRLEKERVKLDRANEVLGLIDTDKKLLSAEWDKAFEKTFIGSVCPTCGRELPEDQLEEKKKEFNRNKAQELDDIENRLKEVKRKETDRRLDKTNAEKEIGNIETFINGMKESLEEAETTLESLKKNHEDEVYATREKIYSDAREIEASIQDYHLKMADDIDAIDAKIKILNEEKYKIDKVIASYEVVKKQEERIEFLQSEQVRLSRMYTDLERMLFLTEQFTIAKVDMLTEKINSNFRLARFKLFHQNINGGIEETCLTTYNGIQFDDLNNGMKINIGLDIISTLCRYYGATAPIMIDNAESVNRLSESDSQIIRLLVTENDKLEVIKKC